MSQPIILMDFDGTLIERDSTIWLIRALLVGNWHKLPGVLVFLVGMFLARGRNPEKLQDLKCRCIGFLIKGRNEGEVLEDLSAYKNLADKMRRVFIVKHMKDAVEKGQMILVVTASPEWAVRFALADLPVTVIGTRYISDEGIFTGSLLSNPCYGARKVVRFEEWVTDSNSSSPDEILESWGDSQSDWHLSKIAKNRFWISSHSRNQAILKDIDPLGTHLLCE